MFSLIITLNYFLTLAPQDSHSVIPLGTVEPQYSHTLSAGFVTLFKARLLICVLKFCSFVGTTFFTLFLAFLKALKDICDINKNATINTPKGMKNIKYILTLLKINTFFYMYIIINFDIFYKQIKHFQLIKIILFNTTQSITSINRFGLNSYFVELS